MHGFINIYKLSVCLICASEWELGVVEQKESREVRNENLFGVDGETEFKKQFSESTSGESKTDLIQFSLGNNPS